MDAQGLTSSQRKLVMWYKVKELKCSIYGIAQLPPNVQYDDTDLENILSILK